MVEGQVQPREAGRVGAMLKERRVQSGYEIADISQFLRIRQPHLRAIEAGRFEDLPGPAYAAGFVRSYAEFLGLDGADIGHRVQADVLPAQAAAPLNMPQPEAETATPKAGILLVGATIALFAYGGWYLTSGHRHDVADLPPTTQGEPSPTYASGGSRGADEPAASTAAREVARLASERAEAGLQWPTPAPEAAIVPANPFGAPAGQEAQPVVASNVPVRAAAPTPGLPPPDAASETEAQFPAQPVQISPTTNTAMAAEPPAAQAVPATESGAAAIGAARIVLKAKSDSWVEVRDPQSNNLLVARLLRAGDAYDVPDRPGLKLVTGNAGGLLVVVDGEAIPPLGKDGAVRRNITLDPDVLGRRSRCAALEGGTWAVRGERPCQEAVDLALPDAAQVQHVGRRSFGGASQRFAGAESPR